MSLKIEAKAQTKQTVGQLLQRIQATGRGQEQAIQKSNTAIPESQKMTLPPKNHVDLDQIKPPSSSEIFENEMKNSAGSGDPSKLEKITDKQIQELFKITQKFKNSPNRGELWLRLAELYVEKAQLVEFRRQGIYQEKLAEFNSSKNKAKPEMDLKESNSYREKAVQLYDFFVRDFPNDGKIDQALFFLGFNYFEMGDVKKGAGYYTRLIKEYPKSPYVDEANFALADYYFENDRWPQAYDNYIKVLQNRTSRLYAFALYKSAWCLYRLGKNGEALKNMEVLIRLGQREKKDQESKIGKKVNMAKLEQEATRDIVIFYAEAGSPDNAIKYFKGLIGNDSKPYLEKLAYLYADRAIKEGAYNIFKEIIAEDPNGVKAFDYQYQIVSLYANQAETNRKFREELYLWIKNYGPKSVWYETNKENKDVIDNSLKLRESTLRNHVLQNHQTAQNSRAQYSQQVASEGYKLYLSEFQGSALYGDMLFFYGELLFDMEKWSEASVHYKRTIDEAPQSKYILKAAINFVLALERDLPNEKEMQKRIGTSFEPVTLEDRVDRFIKAAEWYVSKYPSGERVVEIQFKIGRLYYLSNHFPESEKVFQFIIKTHPKSKQAEYSANLLLDIYNLKKDFAGLEKAGKELLANPEFAGTKAAQEIKSVVEKASFKKAQDLEVNKNYLESAQQFEIFAKQNPRSDLAIMAYFNAGVNFERASVLLAAISSYTAVLNSNDPKSEKLKIKTYGLLPRMYQDTGQYEKAAEAYLLAVHKLGKDPLVSNFIFNAAILFDSLGMLDQANNNYLKYIKEHSAKDKDEVYYRLAEMYRRNGKRKAAAENYQEFLAHTSDKEKIVEVHWKLADLFEQSGSTTESRRWKERTLKIQNDYAPSKKGIGSYYAAKLRLEQAQAIYTELKSIKIPSNPKLQQNAVQLKLKTLNRLNSQLSDVIKYDSAEEIVSSLSLLGQCNFHMYDSLMKAPLPTGLSSDELKQYKEGVAKLADPFQKRAKESFMAAITRGRELDVYNEYYKYSLDMVKVYEPNHHYDGGESAMNDRVINWMGL
jgi:tetratricopeptide (TPR) repeat protein